MVYGVCTLSHAHWAPVASEPSPADNTRSPFRDVVIVHLLDLSQCGGSDRFDAFPNIFFGVFFGKIGFFFRRKLVWGGWQNNCSGIMSAPELAEFFPALSFLELCRKETNTHRHTHAYYHHIHIQMNTNKILQSCTHQRNSNTTPACTCCTYPHPHHNRTPPPPTHTHTHPPPTHNTDNGTQQ